MKKISSLIFLLFVTGIIISPLIAAEKKNKTVSPPKKVIQINDENVEAYLKNGEELLKKGEYIRGLEVFDKIYEYSKTVLKIVEITDEKQREATEGGTLDQKTRETLTWKAKRREALKSRYRDYLARSAYYCGYIHMRRNDTESAIKYLIDTLKNSPYSDRQDSTYMKALSLLAKIYSLEGEL